MKKRLAAVLAATAVLGVTTAFAANPFSDVEPSHWAYQSVAQLAAEGVINGYPDGTFKGQNSITRYEMAQMVAKAMANQDRVDAEQNAMINRLAEEFSEELNTLGVRVSNLEKRVGNVKTTGDFRLRYQENDGAGNDKFDYRGRLQFNANVNDKTSATVRVSSGDVEFGSGDADVEVDRAFVTHNFGKNSGIDLGRTNLVVGQGLVYDDTFDGVVGRLGTDKFKFTAAYGHLMEIDDTNITPTNVTSDHTFTLLQADAKVAKDTTLTGFYLKGNKAVDNEYYGAGVDAKFNKVWVGGEWTKATEGENTDSWVAGVGYGNYDQERKGTWGTKLQYFNEDVNGFVTSSTWNQPQNSDYKGWLASVDYAVAKNVGLNLYYGFNGETQSGADVDDYYRAEVNYKF